VAGAGGSLLDHRGNILASCTWGLGRVSNNVVEAYALYEGVCIAKVRNVSKIVVFGYSMMVVQTIIKKSQSRSNVFNGIISRTLIKGFDEFKIFHIKRDLNPLADQMAKLGTCLESGTLSLNGARGALPIS
jgi:ribonuclease HI